MTYPGKRTAGIRGTLRVRDGLTVAAVTVAGAAFLSLASPRPQAQAPSQAQEPQARPQTGTQTGTQTATGSTPRFTNWRDHGGGPESSQYSPLTQITRENVSQLKIAWTYPTGDDGGYLFNPVVVDGVMYVLAKGTTIVALDAATGKEIWSYAAPSGRIAQRGINYWESTDRRERRLLLVTNQHLQAIDARTGSPIASFGTDGRVDLRVGLDRDPSTINVQSGTPGKVFEDLIILGSATNQEYASAPGDVRAFDVRTGRLVWTFHTVPRPGEFGYDTWPPDAWKTVGGANAWGELSVDAQRGIVYVPTGSAKYNFYGANRRGDNLFGDCLLALDARTGKRRWHFQMVHHDIWDYDNATAPKLMTVRHNGRMVDIVAQAGKTGFLYVFDRVTGEPLWPIEERPVPKSEMANEYVSPTQPFPTNPPPFGRQSFTEKDLSPHIDDPAERARFLAEIRAARNEGLFTPPGTRGYTMQLPGNNGGANFGGAAIDPARGLMFIVNKDWPSLLKLVPAPAASPAEPADPSGQRYRSAFGFMIASNGLPAIAPPWSTLTAYDLNAGTLKWQIPLGDVEALAAKGITNTGSHFPRVGPVVTAGGLLFIGARDRKIRALDVETGKQLWSLEVPAGVEGIPAVYEINGKQYIVYCAAATAGHRTHAPFFAEPETPPTAGAAAASAPAAGTAAQAAAGSPPDSTQGAGARATSSAPGSTAPAGTPAPAAQAAGTPTAGTPAGSPPAAGAVNRRTSGAGRVASAPIPGAYIVLALPDSVEPSSTPTRPQDRTPIGFSASDRRTTWSTSAPHDRE